MTKTLIWIGVILITCLTATSCTTTQEPANGIKKFQNKEIVFRTGVGDFLKVAKAFISADRKAPAPVSAIPIRLIDQQDLLSSTEDAIYRLGHSTLLLRLDSEFILIDPVFSERASLVQWAGPKRFHAPPISIENLPNIKAVIISHDHYDHLDKAAIKQLDQKVEQFVTPLKVGKHLEKWGVSRSKITELNWWQSTQLDSLELTATPAQHYSGRGLFDRDETLWASWVIKSKHTNLFFSGDGGYFSGFKDIGNKYGPFDITMIETGGYNKMWSDIHMLPEQSLQAHLDLRGKAMLPIHNGTFDLALHDWFDPFESINKLAKDHDVQLLTPIFGEPVSIASPVNTTAWWRDLPLSTELEIVIR
jgi:L-ascorbate metabolism protein UlaG (beta-lactamase superfamily)